MKRVQNIAHRGFSGRYPENTNIAFAKALTEGYCDGIEVDVHMTKDNKVVIMHDASLDRTTTGKGYIKDYTFDELRAYDVGVNYGDKYKGQKILCIKDAMNMVKKFNITLYVEIKDDEVAYDQIEAEVLDRINLVGVEDKVVLLSSNVATLKKIKQHKPNLPTGLITSEMTYDIRDYQYTDILCCEYTKVTKDIVDTVHSFGKWVTVWVVDDKSDMKNVIDLGVDAIITNHPDVLSDVINGM